MYRVMLIDDEPWAVKVLKSLINWEEYGFRVVCDTTQPEEAMRLATKHKPHVLFTDISMPGISGLDLAVQLSAAQPGIPFIVFISAYDSFNYAQTAIRLNAFDYLLKPVTEQTLLDVLHKIRSQLEAGDATLESVPDVTPAGAFEQMKHIVDEIKRDMEAKYNNPLNLNDYAEKYMYNYSHLSQMFKLYSGQSFIDFLTELRIRKAEELIRTTSLPISEISERVGYSDFSYFSRIFKKKRAVSPNEIRKPRDE